jgi:hypothetical protein
MFVAPQGIVGLVKRLARAVVRIVPRQPVSRRKAPLLSASVAEDVVVDSPTAGATLPDPRPFTSNQPLKGEA